MLSEQPLVPADQELVAVSRGRGGMISTRCPNRTVMKTGVPQADRLDPQGSRDGEPGGVGDRRDKDVDHVGEAVGGGYLPVVEQTRLAQAMNASTARSAGP